LFNVECVEKDEDVQLRITNRYMRDHGERTIFNCLTRQTMNSWKCYSKAEFMIIVNSIVMNLKRLPQNKCTWFCLYAGS